MNFGKLIKAAVRVAKQNPEIALAAAGVISPKLVSKVAPVVIAVLTKKP